MGWSRYVGSNGVAPKEHIGATATREKVLEKFRLTDENLAQVVVSILQHRNSLASQPAYTGHLRAIVSRFVTSDYQSDPA